MKTVSGHSRVLKIATLALAFALTQSGLVAQTVEIPDPNLEAAIRGALQKPEGDITVVDMESLTELVPDDLRGISDLTGLEKAINLTSLEVGAYYNDGVDNPISDLSPLAGLTNLRQLAVWHSKIREIGPLANLTNLRVLWLGIGEIDDLGPLAGLTNLTELYLADNEIEDLSPLAGLVGLTSLWLPFNRISDIDSIAGLTDLPSLSLAYNRISDISPLAGLKNLTNLRLGGNYLSDISALAGLTNLRDSASGSVPEGLRLSYNYIDTTPGSPARQIIDNLNAIEGLTVVFEPQNDPEPLIGGVPITGQEDWCWSDWWGTYCTTFAPWLYHTEHGFIYRDPSSTTESMYVYDDALDTWCWTSEDVYPFIYAFNPPADNRGTDVEDAWLFYFEGTREPRSFGVLTGESAGQTLFFDPEWGSN